MKATSLRRSGRARSARFEREREARCSFQATCRPLPARVAASPQLAATSMHKFRLYETCPRDGEVLGDESKRDGDGLQDWIVTQDVLKSMSFRGVESLAELAGMWVHYGTCQEYNRDPDEREFASMIMTKRGWVKFDADGTSGSMNMDITQSFWTDMEVIRKKLGLAAGCFDVVRNLSGADVVRYDGAAFDDSSPYPGPRSSSRA